MTAALIRQQKKAASNKLRIKRALLEQDLSIADLARSLGKSRPAVSRSINHGHFPGLQQRILQTLKL